jgi:hypothetical protein
MKKNKLCPLADGDLQEIIGLIYSDLEAAAELLEYCSK